MTTTTARSLTDLATSLERQVTSAASFGAVCTRLLLRSGVNLRTPKPEQVNDRAVVARVADALAEMGYHL